MFFLCVLVIFLGFLAIFFSFAFDFSGYIYYFNVIIVLFYHLFYSGFFSFQFWYSRLRVVKGGDVFSLSIIIVIIFLFLALTSLQSFQICSQSNEGKSVVIHYLIIFCRS